MIEQYASSTNLGVSPIRAPAGRPSRLNATPFPSLNEERLPFTVRLVRNAGDLDKAVSIRHAAYARHVPLLAEKLRTPEQTDFEDGVVVLLAESKLDGSALGTMRIQTNAFKPLSVEQSVQLPPWLQGASLAEATRLGVAGERVGSVVKTVLFKAFFLYCEQAGIDWMVIAGRSPIDRQYERLLFEDVYPGMGYVPLRHANDMPHRVMAFDVNAAESRWAQAKHPLLGFMCYTSHPDIDIRPAASAASSGEQRSIDVTHGVWYS